MIQIWMYHDGFLDTQKLNSNVFQPNLYHQYLLSQYSFNNFHSSVFDYLGH